jgi:hypothetical protein
MENIDDAIRSRSVFDPEIVPQKFEERSDALLAGLKGSVPRGRHRRAAFILKFAAAAVLIIALLTGAAYAAYSLSGGEYFRQLFSAVAAGAPGSYGYMNTDQLNTMASSTVGNVIDTEDLSVDVLGVLVSGNTAQIDVKVTAKKLDSVLYDTGIEPLMNYRFHDDGYFFSFAGRRIEDRVSLTGTIQHIYCDTDGSLAPNQFIIRYTYISEEQLTDKTCVMTFKDFGYFDFDEPDQFVELYEGEWPIHIAFDPACDTSRTVMAAQHLGAGGYSFTVDSVTITPLFCIVNISSDEEYYDEYDRRWSDIWFTLCDNVEDLTVNLTGGTKLDGSQYEASGSGGLEHGFNMIAKFKVPVAVSDVRSVMIGGVEIPLG